MPRGQELGSWSLEGGREGGREGERERGTEGGREGGREVKQISHTRKSIISKLRAYTVDMRCV